MRTIAAIYDSRAEADLARALLASEVKAKTLRVIGKDTAGALDGLKIAPKDADSYRDGLRRGAHLLVAEVTGGATAKRIVELLEMSAEGGDDQSEDRTRDGEQGVAVALSGAEADEKPRAEASAPPPKAAEAPAPAARGTPVEEARVPVVEEEVRVGKRGVPGGGARVRSFTREAQAEETVTLGQERMEVEHRSSGRELSEADIEAGGLFQDRVFEVAEMREEPVVTKVAVVREEVIVRKSVTNRTETIRDTVRHTEIEVEDLPAPSEPEGPRFFVRDAQGRSSVR